MEKKKSHVMAGAPNVCPLVFDRDSKKTCSVKLIGCKTYTAFGYCPIYATWKSSKKFCTVHLG